MTMALTDVLETLETVGIKAKGLDPMQALLIEGRIINDSVVVARKNTFMRSKIDRGGPEKTILRSHEFLQILRDFPEHELAALRKRVAA
jgi:hypothetical protein